MLNTNITNKSKRKVVGYKHGSKVQKTVFGCSTFMKTNRNYSKEVKKTMSVLTVKSIIESTISCAICVGITYYMITEKFHLIPKKEDLTVVTCNYGESIKQTTHMLKACIVH